MAESTIASNGKTTIPADIRQLIGGTAGTRLVWRIEGNGRLFVQVKQNLTAKPPKLPAQH